MSGFTNADGSTLVGGQKPGGQGQALQVDTSGNLLVNVAVGGGGGAGSTVNIADPTTPANKMAIDASGKIGVNNFPATQPVSGTVNVGNFPTQQASLRRQERLLEGSVSSIQTQAARRSSFSAWPTLSGTIALTRSI